MIPKKPQAPGETTSTANTRSVVTFYHEAFDDGSALRQEVDLLDYEVLVETYKFLARNHRKTKSKTKQRLMNTSHAHRRRCHDSRFSAASLSMAGSSHHRHREQEHDEHEHIRGSDIVSDKHKQAILTLVEIDKVTKRVTRIRPEFFPSNIRVLPTCLSRLGALRSLNLEHCQELTSLPAGFSLAQLVEFRVNVTNFQEPFPSSFGNLTNLQTLVVKGNCSSLDDWSKNGSAHDEIGSTTADESLLLFPPSLAKLTNLKHLETHIRNLLQIPAKALEAWSLSLETLVTTQDLLSTHHEPPSETRATPPRRQRSYSTDDSSDDDFDHLLDSSDDEIDDEDEHGFSLLRHSALFRKALEGQLEVRAFRAIAKFQNLRSLKLLFDDSKDKTDFASIRHRLLHRRKNKQQQQQQQQQQYPTPLSKRVQVPYSVPLALLAGPLSMSLRELDIGTCVASSTLSSSKKKSRIPIEICWVDILQDFPMLQRLRLQDCKCSFSSKTQTVDLTASTMRMDHETVLWMPELRQLVLDRCPDFALVRSLNESTLLSARQEALSSPAISFQDDIELVGDEEDSEDDDDGSEEIVFCPLPDCTESSDEDDNRRDTHTEKDEEEADTGNGGDGDGIYFQPLNDEDMDAVMEDPEEINRIIRLSGLLAETVLTPRDHSDDDDDEEEDESEAQKLSDLCRHFLQRCPKLEVVSLRDCKIPRFREDLLESLPKECLRELTLDVSNSKSLSSKTLWAMVQAYPSLVRLQGTCLDHLEDSEFERLRRTLRQRMQPQSSPKPWNVFWDPHKKREEELLPELFLGEENHEGKPTEDPSKPLLEPAAEEERTPPPAPPQQREQPHNGFRLPWPVAAIEQTLLSLDQSRRKTPVLRTIRRSNSRDVL